MEANAFSKYIISEEEIENWLCRNIAEKLDLSTESICADAPLDGLGLDSLNEFTISGELQDWLGIHLPATLLWSANSISELARGVRDVLAESDIDNRHLA